MRYLIYCHKLQQYIRVNSHSTSELDDVRESGHQAIYFRAMTHREIDQFMLDNAIERKVLKSTLPESKL